MSFCRVSSMFWSGFRPIFPTTKIRMIKASACDPTDMKLISSMDCSGCFFVACFLLPVARSGRGARRGGFDLLAVEAPQRSIDTLLRGGGLHQVHNLGALRNTDDEEDDQ